MKTILITLLLLVGPTICFANSDTKIEMLLKNAPIVKNYQSRLTLTLKDNITLPALQKWISQHKGFFYNTDSITIISDQLWHYGSDRKLVESVVFITAENGVKRKAYFDEIKRRKEEERLAEIKRRDDQARAETNRLAKIQSEIENGTFSGKHHFQYPEGEYSGDFVQGLRHGSGVQNLKNGEWYSGSFRSDKFNGRGTYRQSNGVQYTGEFIEGERHGVFIAKKWNIFESHQWEAKYNYGELVYEHFPSSMTGGNNSEDQYANAYNGIDKSRIKYKEMKDYYGEQRQEIIFPDGMGGYIFLDGTGYYISDGIKSYHYRDLEATVKALFIYKKSGLAPFEGRK